MLYIVHPSFLKGGPTFGNLRKGETERKNVFFLKKEGEANKFI